jgi:hypothetical protein
MRLYGGKFNVVSQLINKTSQLNKINKPNHAKSTCRC